MGGWVRSRTSRSYPVTCARLATGSARIVRMRVIGVRWLAGASLVALLCVWSRVSAQAPQPQPQPQAQPPGQQAQPLGEQPQAPGQEEEFPPPVSASAQRIYDEARAELLQVRTLLKGQDSAGQRRLRLPRHRRRPHHHQLPRRQPGGAAAGTLSPRVQHVRSPRKARCRSSPSTPFTTSRWSSPSIRRPLAGHRRRCAFQPRDRAARAGRAHLLARQPARRRLRRDRGHLQRLVERSFYPTIFFAGSLNPGVSGGPTLDQQGRVIGVNVAARRDGEQVSFLVPVAVRRGTAAARRATRRRSPAPAYPELTRQLMAHQETLTARFLAAAVAARRRTRATSSRCRRRTFMRCWGRSTPPDDKGLRVRALRVRDGHARVRLGLADHRHDQHVRHEAYDGRKLGTLRFAQRYSASFSERAVRRARPATRTAPQCPSATSIASGLPRARRAVHGGVQEADRAVRRRACSSRPWTRRSEGVLGRFDARGVSFDNALALAAHYLEGFGWTTAQAASR